jgi:hypothetical protein
MRFPREERFKNRMRPDSSMRATKIYRLCSSVRGRKKRKWVGFKSRTICTESFSLNAIFKLSASDVKVGLGCCCARFVNGDVHKDVAGSSWIFCDTNKGWWFGWRVFGLDLLSFEGPPACGKVATNHTRWSKRLCFAHTNDRHTGRVGFAPKTSCSIGPCPYYGGCYNDPETEMFIWMNCFLFTLVASMSNMFPGFRSPTACQVIKHPPRHGFEILVGICTIRPLAVEQGPFGGLRFPSGKFYDTVQPRSPCR